MPEGSAGPWTSAGELGDRATMSESHTAAAGDSKYHEACDSCHASGQSYDAACGLNHDGH